MKKIGLLGGAFDPIHLGHLAVAKAVLQALKLDMVWFLPSGNHRDKAEVADFEHRKLWIEKAIEEEDFLQVKDWDKGDGEVCYTFDLMQKLPQKGFEYFFVIGEDNASELCHWHKAEWLLENVNFVVVARKEKRSWQELDYAHRLQFVQMELVDVCSANIRKSPEAYQDFLPKVIRKEVVSFYSKK